MLLEGITIFLSYIKALLDDVMLSEILCNGGFIKGFYKKIA